MALGQYEFPGKHILHSRVQACDSMPCNYNFLSDEGKALSAGPGGEVMNWVKRQNKKPNKRLNKLSDDEEVNWVLPTTCSDISPELQTTSYIKFELTPRRKNETIAASTAFKFNSLPNLKYCKVLHLDKDPNKKTELLICTCVF